MRSSNWNTTNFPQIAYFLFSQFSHFPNFSIFSLSIYLTVLINLLLYRPFYFYYVSWGKHGDEQGKNPSNRRRNSLVPLRSRVLQLFLTVWPKGRKFHWTRRSGEYERVPPYMLQGNVLQNCSHAGAELLFRVLPRKVLSNRACEPITVQAENCTLY